MDDSGGQALAKRMAGPAVGAPALVAAAGPSQAHRLETHQPQPVLKHELQALLGREVDLVSPSAVENPFVRAAIDRSLEMIYEA